MALDEIGAAPATAWRMPPEFDPSWPSRSWPQRHWRTLLAVALSLALVLALIVAAVDSLLEPGTAARLNANAVVTGDTLTISGTTDLPDGTTLDGSADNVNSAARVGAFCETAVKAGVFSCSMKVSGWTPGIGLGSIGFAVDDREPQALYDRYGRDGSRLTGPGVRHPDDSVPYYSQVTYFGFTVP